MYAWVARNRGRFGCASDVCELPAPPAVGIRSTEHMLDGIGSSRISARSTQAFIRAAYGVLMLATLVQALPHARRFFVSERWGGYAERGHSVSTGCRTRRDAAGAGRLVRRRASRWRSAGGACRRRSSTSCSAATSSSRCGGGACCAGWARRASSPTGSALAVFLLEFTRSLRAGSAGLALLVLQVDFAFIMLSAGVYKFTAGYPRTTGWSSAW